jgi:hypothetical protein
MANVPSFTLAMAASEYEEATPSISSILLFMLRLLLVRSSGLRRVRPAGEEFKVENKANSFGCCLFRHLCYLLFFICI